VSFLEAVHSTQERGRRSLVDRATSRRNPLSFVYHIMTEGILRSKDFNSGGKYEKAFTDYLQENVACVIASVTANGGLASLEPHVQALNE
jgi:hypothetical protein